MKKNFILKNERFYYNRIITMKFFFCIFEKKKKIIQVKC